MLRRRINRRLHRCVLLVLEQPCHLHEPSHRLHDNPHQLSLPSLARECGWVDIMLDNCICYYWQWHHHQL